MSDCLSVSDHNTVCNETYDVNALLRVPVLHDHHSLISMISDSLSLCDRIQSVRVFIIVVWIIFEVSHYKVVSRNRRIFIINISETLLNWYNWRLFYQRKVIWNMYIPFTVAPEWGLFITSHYYTTLKYSLSVPINIYLTKGKISL